MKPAILALALVACTASAREKTISATLTSMDTARTAFVNFDGSHQMDIVNKAPDRATAEAQLATYRQTQSKVEAAFAVGYRAIAVAQQLQDDQSVSSMIAAAAIVVGALKDLGVSIP